MKIKPFLLSAFTIISLGLSIDPVDAAAYTTSEYFLLANKNSVDLGAGNIITMTGPVSIGGGSAVQINYPDGDSEYYGFTASGLNLFGFTIGGDTVPLDTALNLLPGTLTLGQTYSASGTFFYQGNSWVIDSTVQVLDEEDVSLPSGAEFKNAVHVMQTLTLSIPGIGQISSTQSETWHARNLGQIKELNLDDLSVLTAQTVKNYYPSGRLMSQILSSPDADGFMVYEYRDESFEFQDGTTPEYGRYTRRQRADGSYDLWAYQAGVTVAAAAGVQPAENPNWATQTTFYDASGALQKTVVYSLERDLSMVTFAGPQAPDNRLSEEYYSGQGAGALRGQLYRTTYAGGVEVRYLSYWPGSNSPGITQRYVNGTLTNQNIYSHDAQGTVTSYMQLDFDSNGDVIQTHLFDGITYNAAGRAQGYTRTDVRENGQIRGIHVYSGVTYDASGRVIGTTQQKMDPNGVPLRGTAQSNIVYDALGRIASYTISTLDSGGQTLKVYAANNFSYNSMNRVLGFIKTDVATGSVMEMAGYQYDALGRLLGYNRTDKDPSGNILGEYVYAADGLDMNLQSKIITDRDAGGAILMTHEFTYQYEGQGLVSSFTRTDTDAAGNVLGTDTYSFTYYASGNRQSYNIASSGVTWEYLDEVFNGKKPGRRSKRTEANGTFIIFEYWSGTNVAQYKYKYDDQAQLILTYEYDASGNLIHVIKPAASASAVPAELDSLLNMKNAKLSQAKTTSYPLPASSTFQSSEPGVKS